MIPASWSGYGCRLLRLEVSSCIDQQHSRNKRVLFIGNSARELEAQVVRLSHVRALP
jgi:hypothetical protein